MANRTTLPLLVALFLLGAGITSAAVIPLSQTRTIQGSAYAEDAGGSDSGSEQMDAPDFGHFQDGVGVTISLDGAHASGSATQNSQITSNGFDAQGSSAANAEGYDEYGFGDASGQSRFIYSFELTEATDFVLTGFLEAYDSGYASLNLTGPGGSLFDDGSGNNYQPVNESGTLAAGEYTITLNASSSAYGDWFYYDYGFAEFILQFELQGTTCVAGGTLAKGVTLSASPNPFPGQTAISYATPREKPTSLEVFDLRGRLVRHLVAAGPAAGSLTWDGRNDQGRPMSQGTYFLRLKSGDLVHQEKVTLLR